MVRKKPKWMCKKKSSHSLVPQREKYLEKIYFDPSHPGSFKGENKLYQAVKNEGKHINFPAQNLKMVTGQRILQFKQTCEFKRLRVIVMGMHDQYEADLVDM